MPAPGARSNEKILALHDLSGGLNTSTNEQQIPPNCCVYGEGVNSNTKSTYNLVWLDGYLRPFPGLEPQEVEGIDFSTTYQYWSIVYHNSFLVDTGPWHIFVKLLLIKDENSTDYELWYSQSGVSTVLANDGEYFDTGITITSVPRNGLYVDALAFDQKLYVTGINQEVLIYYPSSDTWSDLTTDQSDADLLPPNYPALITRTPARLFLVTYAANLNCEIHWSDFKLPLVWNGPTEDAGSSGSQIVTDSDNYSFSALESFGTTVYFFTEYEIYIGKPDPSSTYKFEKVHNDVGCLGPRCITPLENGTFCWLDANGIYIGTPGQSINKISDSIRLILKEVEVLPPEHLGGTVDFYNLVYDKFNGLIYLFFTPGSAISHIFCFNTANGSWWYGFTNSIACAKVYRDSAFYGNPEIFVTPRVYNTTGTTNTTQADVYKFTFDSFYRIISNNTVNNVCAYNSKIHHFLELSGGKFQQGDIQKIRAIGKDSGSLPLAVNQGNNWDRMTSTTIGTQTMDDTGATNPDFYVSGKTNEQSEYFQVAITATSVATFPPVAGFQISFIDKGDTRQKS